MQKTLYCLIMLFFAGLANNSHADCTGECLQYCGPNGSHGYCVDYIQTRLGIKQSGNACDWTGNVSADNIQPNDVAIFNAPSPTGHVAVIDSIDGDDIFISEWNYGSKLDPAGNTCGVTNEYGRLHSPQRKISKSSVSRFWRPTGSAEAPLPYRLVDNLAWYPPNKSCIDAERWIFYSAGYPNGAQSIGYSSICQQEEYNMIIALGGYSSDWYAIIYGTQDLDQVLTCHQ